MSRFKAKGLRKLIDAGTSGGVHGLENWFFDYGSAVTKIGC